MRAVRAGCPAPIMGLSTELAAEASSGTDEASSSSSGSGAEHQAHHRSRFLTSHLRLKALFFGCLLEVWCQGCVKCTGSRHVRLLRHTFASSSRGRLVKDTGVPIPKVGKDFVRIIFFCVFGVEPTAPSAECLFAVRRYGLKCLLPSSSNHTAPPVLPVVLKQYTCRLASIADVSR
jgi:hypothetical protein